MGISIADNFQYQGKKPLDSRTSYATLAAMKAVTDATISEGCLAYCEETDKYYKFKSSNTVDADTGKWREYSGGSGAESLNDLQDVNINSVRDGEVLAYDYATSKWVNYADNSDKTPYVFYSEITLSKRIQTTTNVPTINLLQIDSRTVHPTAETILYGRTFVFDADGTIGIINQIINNEANIETIDNSENIQFSTMPTANASLVGRIVQFIGATDTYINGYFYECVNDNGTYSWVAKAVQAGGSGGTSSYNDLTDKPTLNSETISGDKTSDDFGLQDKMQFSEMPTASANYLDKIVQFVGTTGTYTNGYYYKCVSDGEATPTYSWEAQYVQPSGGGGGDAELEESITTNLTVGAVPSGTTLAQGTSFTEVMKKLFVTELAPTTTFTASGSGIKEVGTSVTPTLTLTITDKGTGTPVSIKFYDGSTLLDTQNYVDGTNTYTYTMSAVTTTKTVKGVLEYKKSDNTNGTVEKSATYTFVMASYYGAVTTAPTDKAGITALTKNVKNTKAQTATFTLSNQRSCYCYPASFGNLTSIKDANNFEYLSSYTKTTVAVDGVDYNVYTLTDPVTATGFKQVYA